MHILVVDDKQLILDKVSSLLTSVGYTFELAINGLDALEKAQKSHFNLYIVDHLMPIMNGLQFVKNVKAKACTANTPILFMTTQDVLSIENFEEYQQIDSIIAKPFNQDSFFNKINQLLKENSVVHSL